VGGILNEEPTAAVQKAVEAGLVEFEKHKKTLLDHLSKNRRAPWLCDDEQWSLRLTRLAKIYYLCQATRPAAQRKADLRKLAETLGQVCTFAEKVRQDSVGSELVSQFFEGILRRDPPSQIVPDGESFRVVYFSEIDLKEMVASLDSYRAAVLRAADDVPSTLPGPSPSLPLSYIRTLAGVYQEATRRRAGRGVGPFAPALDWRR
jgi:hypothetical protein